MTNKTGNTQTGPPTDPPALSGHVAAEIRADLGRKELSYRQLATLLGVSPMWVSGRLSGQTAITLDDLVLIATALRRPVVFFLPDAVGEVWDEEIIKSRPLRSRPARHASRRVVKPTEGYAPGTGRTTTQDTHEYPRGTRRPTTGRPNSRPPNRPDPGRPKGRPEEFSPFPATRRPSRIGSPSVDPTGALRIPAQPVPRNLANSAG